MIASDEVNPALTLALALALALALTLTLALSLTPNPRGCESTFGARKVA